MYLHCCVHQPHGRSAHSDPPYHWQILRFVLCYSKVPGLYISRSVPVIRVWESPFFLPLFRTVRDEICFFCSMNGFAARHNSRFRRSIIFCSTDLFVQQKNGLRRKISLLITSAALFVRVGYRGEKSARESIEGRTFLPSLCHTRVCQNMVTSHSLGRKTNW